MKKITLLLFFVLTLTVQGQNKLLSDTYESYDNGNWTVSRGTNYEYDSNNNLTSSTDFNWDSVSSKWVNAYKSTYAYNASNKVTQDISLDWNSTTNTYDNGYKQTYTYTSGKLTQIDYSKWLNGSWVADGKTDITYNSNNLPISAIDYEWNGTQYVNYYKYTYTYNSNNKLIESVDQNWVGSQWVNSYKGLYTYNSNNQLILNRSAEWDEFNSIWVQNNDRTDYELDTNGNEIKVTESGSNYGFRQEYTYDTSKLMSAFAHPFKDKTGVDYFGENIPHINKVLGYTDFNYDNITSSYKINGRTTYNYNNAITLGTEQFETAIPTITVYPNPAQDFISVQASENKEIDEVIITDISGKIVLQQVPVNKQINVQNLAKGMYVIQVFSGDSKWDSKFLKE